MLLEEWAAIWGFDSLDFTICVLCVVSGNNLKQGCVILDFSVHMPLVILFGLLGNLVMGWSTAANSSHETVPGTSRMQICNDQHARG